ncbi:hypothetical protein BGZ80_008839, partial [Entomortierella chlamydospora]
INWKKHVVTFHDKFCIKNCIKQYPVSLSELLLSENILAPDNCVKSLSPETFESESSPRAPEISAPVPEIFVPIPETSALVPEISALVPEIPESEFCFPDLASCHLHFLETEPLDSFYPDLGPTIEDYYLCQSYLDHYHSRFLELNPLEPEVTTLHNLETTPVTLPHHYSDLASLFEDKEPGVLPPHRPFDHTIPLEPDSKVPFGR